MKQKKVRLASVSFTRWAFYEAMENGSRESMADWFETLHHHYKNTKKKVKTHVCSDKCGDY